MLADLGHRGARLPFGKWRRPAKQPVERVDLVLLGLPLFPFTGSKAELSGWGVHGVQAAMQDINQAGGVMGKKMKVVSSDDAADSVDALPALRLLLLSNPVAVIGPFSPTIQAVIHDLAANNVADFALGGTALTSMARGGSGAPSTTPDAGLWTGSAQSPDRSWQRPLPESA